MNKAQLTAKNKAELLEIAQRLGLRGMSTLNKPELVEAIAQAKQKSISSRSKQAPVGSAATAKAATELKRRAVRKRVQADTAAAAAWTPKILPTAKPVATQPASAARKPKTASKIVAATPSRGGKAVKAAKGASAAIAPVIAPPSAEELAAHKFDVTPSPTQPKQVFQEDHLGELPDAYGTGRLFLAARDPHWLYAYWDLTGAQMADYRGQAPDGQLKLRLFEKGHVEPIQEHSFHHDVRNWYLPVNKAATTYSAQLGFWERGGGFHVVSQSREATTPADAISAETSAQFVTIPMDVSFQKLFDLIRGHLRDGEKLAEALHRLESEGFHFPFQVGVELGPWTAEQTLALERILGGEVLRTTKMGSLEITEWLRRRMQEQMGSAMFSAFSPSGSSWQSAAPAKGFWFAVNAEVIIYGATEPDAKVTVDGKPIKLKSDGTFSFHYTFPDGQYHLPIVAVAAAGHDQRTVELSFERKTRTKGAVGKVKQPAHLKAPAAA